LLFVVRNAKKWTYFQTLTMSHCIWMIYYSEWHMLKKMEKTAFNLGIWIALCFPCSQIMHTSMLPKWIVN
jgi:hypothetical protein